MNINISKVKIMVTVPVENADELRKVIGDAGAGVIGNYTYCSVTEKCIGRFKGTSSSNPYIGEQNKLEKVEEEKIEIQCDIQLVEKVLKRIREVHPYEEVGVDIVPLILEDDLVNIQ